ncbi:MAG TPA: hypothetical protein VM940_15745 [Chthoniobacterales bacterium]|jgi:hypothetical protein|nr:hypothetical protein [Chthoniobacterales bacterium]
MPAASLHALLKGAIDYAGLFPPANLALEPALRNHAEYIRHDDAWMLGAFILPVAEFDAASRWLTAFDQEHPLRISALGPRTENADGFVHSLSGTQSAVDMFRSRFGDAAAIEQFEMPLPPDADAKVLTAAEAALDHSRVRTFFWESPAKSAPKTIELIAEQNRRQPRPCFGFKLRTGGVTAEAFPTSEAIASALFATMRNRVPIKFTAGLHHPVRLFHESVQTKMHGFLNVLGAGVLASAHSWTEEQIVKMLEDEDPASFRFTDEEFAWRDWQVRTDAIVEARRLVTSLGSCSFDEPREDLIALKLLETCTRQHAPL